MAITSRADDAFFAEAVTIGATGYLVDGASQSGTTLTIKTGTGSISKGQTFTVAGVSWTYTVVSVTNLALTDATYATAVTTVKFAETLASSPSDEAAITLASTLPLPPHLITKSVTLVNSASNSMTVADHIAAVHGFALVAGAGLTIEVSDTASIFIKGTANDVLSIVGS